MSETDSSSSDEATGSEDEVAAWIGWFCSLKGNEFFCEVDEEFIQDDFNLSGLSSQVTSFCICPVFEIDGSLSVRSWEFRSAQSVGIICVWCTSCWTLHMQVYVAIPSCVSGALAYCISGTADTHLHACCCTRMEC